MTSLGLHAVSTPTNYVIVGMAGFLAGTTHAPLTAILLLFEITGNYAIILPIMIAAVLATTCSQLIHPHSIYSLHLREMGIKVCNLSDLALLRKMTLRQAGIKLSPAVHPNDPVEQLVEKAKGYPEADFAVTDLNGQYLGMVARKDFRAALLYRDAIPLLVVEELMRSCCPLSPDDTLETALTQFTLYDLDSLPVVEANRVLGLVTHNEIMKTYQQALEANRT